MNWNDINGVINWSTSLRSPRYQQKIAGNYFDLTQWFIYIFPQEAMELDKSFQWFADCIDSLMAILPL